MFELGGVVDLIGLKGVFSVTGDCLGDWRGDLLLGDRRPFGLDRGDLFWIGEVLGEFLGEVRGELFLLLFVGVRVLRVRD